MKTIEYGGKQWIATQSGVTSFRDNRHHTGVEFYCQATEERFVGTLQSKSEDFDKKSEDDLKQSLAAALQSPKDSH